MKKRFLLILAIFILIGCQNTSWATHKQQMDFTTPTHTIKIAVPPTMDDTMDYALILFSAKVKELSGNTIDVQQVPIGDFKTYHQPIADLYLLTAQQVASLDERTDFAQLPFLFRNSDIMFHYLNSPHTALRTSSVTQERLDGQIVTVYQADPYWFLSKGKLYPEIGFSPSVGITGTRADDLFVSLHATTIYNNDFTSLEQVYVDKTIKYIEMTSSQYLSGDVLSCTKAIIDIGHRYNSWWFVARDSVTADDHIMSIIHEAAAYTLTYHDATRSSVDDARMTDLYHQIKNEPYSMDYQYLFDKSQVFYEENHAEVGIPIDIWREIYPFIKVLK